MAYTLHTVENEIDIEGFYVFFSREYPKNFVSIKENHNFWEIVYIKDGSVILLVDDESYSMNSGDILFIKPMSHHMTINTGIGTVCKYIMSFSAKGSFLDSFKNKIFTLNEEQRTKFEEIFSYPLQFCPLEVSARMFSLFDDCQITPTILQILKNKVELFMLESMNDVNLMKYDNPHIIPKPIVKAITIMRENCDKALSVDEIATMSHTSSATLKKLFQKYMKCGVHDYFLSLKMAEAIILLGAGMSVSETAEKLSFKSQSYFSTAFKRITGASPTSAEFLAKNSK